MARKPKAAEPVVEPVETDSEPVVEVTKMDPGHAGRPKYDPLPEPEPEVAEAPAIVKHSQRLLSRATELGIDQETIDTTPSEALDEMVYRLNRQAAKLAREQAAEERALNLKDPPKVVEAPPPPDPLAFAEDDYDPNMREVFKTVRQLRDENKQLKEQLGGVQGVVQSREARTTAEILDDAFDSLGATYSHVFGTGPVSDLTADSPELERRNLILTRAGINYQTDSKKVIAKKLKAAVERVYPAKAAEPDDELPEDDDAGGYAPAVTPVNRVAAKLPKTPLQERREKWSAGSVGQPTNRATGQEPTGRSKAIRTVEALLEERDTQNGTPREKFKV